VVVIVLFAAGILVSVFLVSQRTVSTDCITVACALSFSGPANAAAGTNHWYNFTVLRLNSTISADNMNFEVTNYAHTILYPLPLLIFIVHPGSAKPLAEFNYSAVKWAYGSTVNIVRGDVLPVEVGSSVEYGDSLVILGSGTISSTLSLPLN
jgi:hypothetical protein